MTGAGVPSAVDWPTKDLLAIRAGTTPERTALVDADTGEEWAVHELDAAVDTMTQHIESYTADAGSGDGGRIGVLLDTRPEYVMLLFAAMRRGVTLVPLNVRNSADELTVAASRADLGLLVCESETEVLARSVAPADCPVASVDDPEDDAVEPLSGGDAYARPSRLTRDTETLLMFTSGTTGRPKGVRLTLGNLVASATASAFRLGITRRDRWLVCLPMYHMGGLAPVVRSMLYGTTAVVQSAFDPESIARVIDEHQITGVSLVPTMLRRLLDDGWSPPEHLRFVLLGGAAASRELLDRALAAGVPVFPTYGMTEASSQIATATPEQVAEFPDTVGQPLVNTQVRVLAADGSHCDVGETGELVVSGPTVTPGYLDDEHTDAAFSEHGFHTGDLGHRDVDGRLWVTGRADDRIVSGGENVDPELVASAIRDHPKVGDVAVVGLADAEWGERVAALVVPTAGEAELSEETVRVWCRERLADYEVPKTVRFARELPRTASGTIDREAVRERLGD
ncbi:o-succinylbenzoate--CoA ligase [Haloarchaeobius sp. DFWS5]|uniref:o-succinylbenzoate--CoA ligase n=1 Tax=Haloarchaeobius sp. DFWS5 TaxID=3446114 RepID=UPI003EBF2D05